MKDKVALVTGAAHGIGLATAELFAKRGAAVVLSDIDAAGEAAAQRLADGGAKAHFVRTDVQDRDAVQELVQETVRRFGGLDHAFNNAGIEGQFAPFAEGTIENWQRTLSVNLTGVYHCMQAEVPAMRKRGGGAIVNCSSVAGLLGLPQGAAYVASKHGVIGLTRSAAVELAPENIRVNAVCPGGIDTPMLQRYMGGDEAARQAMVAMHPIGRIGRPEEIAEATVWLCSDAASFVTGQALPVDGGWTVP